MEWFKVLVICSYFCVLKCAAMSVSEIEEFSNFLKKTSQLDEILKKGTSPDDDFDEDEHVSDHAWEESGKFEGDLILNERQRRLIVENVAEGLSRNGLKDGTKRWPDNEVVYYIQKEHFSGDQVQAIQDGIEDLARASCVKFRPYRKGDRDAVVIQGSRRGCFSQVGYQGGYQVLNLSGRHPVGRGCFRHGTVVHELLHTLGFYHMQSSPDRDDYIDVKWENIIQPAKHNFRKYNAFSVSDFGVGYDYDSVLHYSRRAFSANGRDTLVPKQSGASIGQRVGLSDKDAQKLNKMYCDADSNNADANEESKPVIKKKKPKNKPFEGHGIGYHQGKAVVIKLPAAETYKLPAEPTFYVFDHFSKSPQAVSPAVTEGIGAGEEVTYHYEPEEFNAEEFSKPITPKVHDESNNTEKPTHFDYNNDVLESAKPEVNNDSHHSTDTENSKDTTNKTEEPYSSGKASDDLNEAFDRLGKIIKTHVYPSQMPDFDLYKANIDYSEFYNPERQFKPEPEIAKVDKAFDSTSIPSKEKINERLDSKDKEEFIKDETNKKTENESEDIEKQVEVSPESQGTNAQSSNEFGSSYGTTYPLKKMPQIKDEKFITPEYATLKHLSHRHDYSGLYQPSYYDSPQKGKSKLFGNIVPLRGEYNNDDFKKDNEKYDHDQYSHALDKDKKENSSLKLLLLDPGNSKEAIFGSLPSGKGAYSLFGVLVPLRQKWYKVEFDPHKGSYSIEKHDSSEDYR